MRHLIYLNFIMHLPVIPRDWRALLCWAGLHLVLLSLAKRF